MMGSKCSKKGEEESWDKYMVGNAGSSSRPVSHDDGESGKVRFDADLPQEEGPKINWDALEKETQALNLRYVLYKHVKIAVIDQRGLLRKIK